MKAILLAAALLFAPLTQADIPVPEARPCVQAIDVLKNIKSFNKGQNLDLNVIFRYEEARYFGETAGWSKETKTFYYIFREEDQLWMIFGADKDRCVTLLDGGRAYFDKESGMYMIGMIMGRGIAEFATMVKYVRNQVGSKNI